MYDKKTGIKIQRLTSAQYDHLFYLLLYASPKHPYPTVNVKSLRRVIDYTSRTVRALYNKGLVQCPNMGWWWWTNRFRVRVTKAGVIAFRYAQLHPETISGRD